MEFHNTDGVVGNTDLFNKYMYNNTLSENKVFDIYNSILALYSILPYSIVVFSSTPMP